MDNPDNARHYPCTYVNVEGRAEIEVEWADGVEKFTRPGKASVWLFWLRDGSALVCKWGAEEGDIMVTRFQR